MRIPFSIGLMIGLVMANIASAQPSREALVDAMVKFEQQYLAGSFAFESEETYKTGPAWPDGTVISRQNGIWRRNSQSEIHVERVASSRNLYHSIAYSIPEGLAAEEIPDRYEDYYGFVLSDQSNVYTNGRKGPQGKRFASAGTINSNKRDTHWQVSGGRLSFLFGFERYLAHSDTSISDILRDNEIETWHVSLNGKNCWQATTRSSLGICKVWFSVSPELLPLQFEIQRKQDDFLWEGEDARRVRDIGGYGFGKKMEPYLTGFTVKYSDLGYTEVEGKQLCNRFVFSIRESFEGGQTSESVASYSICDIDLNEPDIKSHSLDFQLFSIPEKTTFNAFDAPRIPYVVSDGKVCKVVNETTLETIEGVRFAMPGKRARWPLILGVAAATALCGLFWYQKRKPSFT